MDKPLLSVIIPVYNTSDCLKRCLDSLFRQTSHDFEVLAVDDGSTDNSFEILTEYAKDFPPLNIFRQEHKGQSAARNLALSRARGDWLLFVDSDDYVEDGFCSVPLAEAERSGADLVLFQANRVTWPNGIALILCALPPGIYEPDPVLRALCSFSIQPNLWNKLYRRSLFRQIRFPEGELWEDVAVMHELIARAKRISVIPDLLYHYTDRPGATTKNAQEDLSVYYWRWLQYGKRYRFLSEYDPDIAREMLPSRMETGLKYCAALSLTGPEEQFQAFRTELLSEQTKGQPLPLKLRAGLALLKRSPGLFRKAAERTVRRKRQGR